ncbi:hypothetical protein V3Q90_06300 [Flavobacterium oreochromis]|uniref:hypothetical protein n=1 Tax=Flavobacterium oreochromis TaxID=2906078 RepID=UPI00385BBD5C
MKLAPITIIKMRVFDYLSVEEQNVLISKFPKSKSRRKELNTILKHFDIEVFLKSPKMEEDIWLYNYIKYEITKTSIPRTKLIARYETKYLKQLKV